MPSSTTPPFTILPTSLEGGYYQILTPLSAPSAEFTMTGCDFLIHDTLNTVYSFGYNANPGGGRKDPSEPAWMWSIESNYNNGSQNLMEMHMQGIHSDGTPFRNWSWSVDRASKAIGHSIGCDYFSILDRTLTNQVVKFNITSTSCAVIVSSGTVFTKSPNNHGWLYQSNAAASSQIEMMRVNASNEVVMAPGGGVVRIPNLAGSGVRSVVVDANGVLIAT